MFHRHSHDLTMEEMKDTTKLIATKDQNPYFTVIPKAVATC